MLLWFKEKEQNEEKIPFKFEPKKEPEKHNQNVVSALTESLNNKIINEHNSFLSYLKFEGHVYDVKMANQVTFKN